MPKPNALPDNVEPNGKSLTKTGKKEYCFLVKCLKCGSSRKINRRQHAINLSSKPCKRCSNKNNNPIGVVGSIRLSFFNKYKINAEMRSKDWSITAQDANLVLENQNHKCALTGVDISANGPLESMTASLDRIDNSIGYTKNNIQWVHKRINMMRGTLSIDEFKEMCRLVSSFSLTE